MFFVALAAGRPVADDDNGDRDNGVVQVVVTTTSREIGSKIELLNK